MSHDQGAVPWFGMLGLLRLTEVFGCFLFGHLKKQKRLFTP